MFYPYHRTHTCGVLRLKEVGQQVTLTGWVNRRRDHGGLIFIDLRDRFGITQLVFDPVQHPQAHAIAETLRAEWVIVVRGGVVARGTGLNNPKLATGEIEVRIESIEVISKAKTPPFSISDEVAAETNEELRLKYRYLDMRRGDVAKKLVTRHQTMMATRRYFDQNGFIEVTTPILGKSTPEGARDYLVPSRIYPGSFYALPQSPQIFKQLLMIGGIDRYFQIAPCFRDEDLRADRQPEFTQIDVEMSFGCPDDLMRLVEGLMKTVFHECAGLNIQTPIRRLTHAYCIENYGSDRPDLRFDMKLHDLSEIVAGCEFGVFLDQLSRGAIVKGLCVKGGADLSRRAIDEYAQFVAPFGIQGLAWMKFQDGALTSQISKFFSPEISRALIEKMGVEDQDLIFMIAEKPSKTNQALDHLRRKLARDRNLISPGQYEFLWVTDFPLFSWNEEENRLQSEHHPFTSPHPEDIHLLDTAPLKVRSLGYDLVLNGYEIGGGSQRIHQNELQTKIFTLLQLSPTELTEKFGFFLEALSFGTPPHLGIAFGLDRLIMILTGTDNIRDVIAFPKTQKASDLMMDSPSGVSSAQLRELGLKTGLDKSV